MLGSFCRHLAMMLRMCCDSSAMTSSKQDHNTHVRSAM
jgi:hypothetical protein